MVDGGERVSKSRRASAGDSEPSAPSSCDRATAVMKAGTVCVDLAAAAGGNIATTSADQKVVTPNGVTCIGYTDLNSRLATTSSSSANKKATLSPPPLPCQCPTQSSRVAHCPAA